MIKIKSPIYICSITPEFADEIKSTKRIAGHEVGQIKKRKIIHPNKIDPETINPLSFIELKEKLKIDELLFIDQIKGADRIITISDHVNISGQNYLRSKTPEGDLPTFPDMSKIYNDVNGFDKAIVYTVGWERVESEKPDQDKILSESIGIVAPIAHYVGIKVFALGHSNLTEVLKIILEI